MTTKHNYQPLLNEWARCAADYYSFIYAFQNTLCREFLIYADGTYGKSGGNNEHIILLAGPDHYHQIFVVEDPNHSALDGLKHWLDAHGYQITVLHEYRRKATYDPVGYTVSQETWMLNMTTAIERGEIPEANTPLKQRLLADVRKDLASRATVYATRLLIRAPPRVGLPPRKYLNASSWNLPEDLILGGVGGVKAEVKISSALVKLREAEYPNPPENHSWFGFYFSSDIFKKIAKGDPSDSSGPDEVNFLDFSDHRPEVLQGFKSFLIDPEGFRNELIKHPTIHYIRELLKLSKFLMFDSFTYFLLSIGEHFEQNNIRGFVPETIESRIELADEGLDLKKPLYPGFIADFARNHLELAPTINAKLWNNRSYSDYIVALLNLPNESSEDDSYIRDHAPDMRSFKSSQIIVTEQFTGFYGDQDMLYIRPHQEGALILAIVKNTNDLNDLLKLHGHDLRFKVCLNNNQIPVAEIDLEACMYQIKTETIRYNRLRGGYGNYTREEVVAEFPDEVPYNGNEEDIAEED